MHSDENSRIKLDAPSVDARADLYPQELREPYIWLCGFIRDECHRDLDNFIERANKVKACHDKTTWSKIIRGRWNRDSNDRELDTPVVKLTTLLREIEVIRNDSRIREQGGRVPFILTKTARSIFDFVDKKRAPDRVCKFGIIIGHTGTGKTAALREYAQRNNHGAVVWLDAPERPSVSRFKTDLAGRYGCGIHTSVSKKETAISASVNDRRCIILENVQRLYDPRLEDRQPIFEYLQKLQEESGCTVILSHTPTFSTTFSAGRAKGFFEQFEGRAGGAKTFLTLTDYPPDDDILAVAAAFELQDADDHIDYLKGLCREPGRIRILFETLQEAKIRAVRRKEKLTIDHLKYVRDED